MDSWMIFLTRSDRILGIETGSFLLYSIENAAKVCALGTGCRCRTTARERFFARGRVDL